MFAANGGDRVLPVTASASGLYYSATADSRSRRVYLKVVNPATRHDRPAGVQRQQRVGRQRPGARQLGHRRDGGVDPGVANASLIGIRLSRHNHPVLLAIFCSYSRRPWESSQCEGSSLPGWHC
jgi:hypothetical protein